MRPALFLSALIAIAALTGPVVAAPVAAADVLTPLRVIVLMRHGVRPPTRVVVIPDGYAREPWAAWDTAPGLLTAHGYRGEVLLGAYDRLMFADAGLLETEACPAPRQVRVWADTDQRTRETGRAWLEGLYPGCDIPVGHSRGQRDDPLFAAIDLGVAGHDPAMARAAVEARAGGALDGTMPAVGRAFERLDAILDCCSVTVCEEAGLEPDCALGQIPHRWEATDPAKRIDFEGPLAIGGTAGQTVMLQYLEGKPMSEVGWGRATEADFILLSTIHAAEFELLSRTPYIADRGATPIMRTVLENFGDETAPRLHALIGHDTNVGNVGGMLDLHWRVPSYPRDNPPPGGALGFEVLSDASGARFVRAFYRSQTMDQVRELQPLGDANPASYDYLPIPGCADPCRLETFDALVRGRLVASVTPAR